MPNGNWLAIELTDIPLHAAKGRCLEMGVAHGSNPKRLLLQLATLSTFVALAACSAAGQSDNNQRPATPASAEDASAEVLNALLTADGQLKFPADYREWVFLSSGHGMSYRPETGGPHLPFDNVFVDHASYRSFLETGTWPEGTVFVLEIRPGRTHGSINKRGAFQSGEPIAVEVHAKDSRRFATGWAFFSFSGTKPAAAIPTEADCYSCHQQNGAVDTTFVQFYPTLLPIAESKRTLTSNFLASLKGEK